MNKKHLFFAALFLAALAFGFVGCENPDDGIDNDVKYKLEANSNNTMMGTVVGSGTYKKGTEVSITAKPNDFYHLCTWSDCDTKDLVRKVVVNSDTTITAIFSDNPYLRVKSNNTSWGTVSGSGTYEIGSEVIIMAKPKANSRFLSWSDCDSKELTRTVVVNTDSTIVANFALNPYLTAKPNNASYGTVTGSGRYEMGTKVTITAATKGENFYFKGWSDCDSKELKREVVITSDTTITAIFTADPYLNVKSNNTSLGTVTGSGYYKSGTKVTITATPEPYQFFRNWSDSDTKDLTRTITVTSDTTIIANFATKHSVTVGNNTLRYELNGMIYRDNNLSECEIKNVAGYYLTGDEVVLEVTTIPLGFKFEGWVLEGKNTSYVTKNPATIVVNEDMTISANFTLVNTDTISGSENRHNYVDLGLPSELMWATCNVGALNSKKDGYLYAWGETEPKNSYNYGNYKFMAPDSASWRGINKYTIDDKNYKTFWYKETKTFLDYDYNGKPIYSYSYEFRGDNKTTLEPEDNAVAVNMGGKWRMPTREEFEELNEYCNWIWGYIKNENEYFLVGVSKINGNRIIFPLAGTGSQGSGYYWVNSLASYSTNAHSLQLTRSRIDGIVNTGRCDGCFVRGVFSE